MSATGVTGYVWLENVGWVQLDYDGVAGATNTTSTNWGVINDGNGNLGGYAWGENIGWINFHPTNSQVIISGGNFSGYAWSENIGWIKFDHAQTSNRPATTWTADIASVAAIVTPTVTSNISRSGQFVKRPVAITPTISVPPTIPPPASSFTRDLEKGMTGNDIKLLQIYLNTHGYIVAKSGAGSADHETTYFGPATKAALIKFQKAKGIKPAIGYFGSITRKYIVAR